MTDLMSQNPADIHFGKRQEDMTPAEHRAYFVWANGPANILVRRVMNDPEIRAQSQRFVDLFRSGP